MSRNKDTVYLHIFLLRETPKCGAGAQ